MLNQRLIEGINQQINLELSSSYFYLGLSATFDKLRLPGLAHWMRIQSTEELSHANRFINFLRQCDAPLILENIEKPIIKCKCLPEMECSCSDDGEDICSCEIYQEALFQEERITAHVTTLAELAVEEKQYGALALFQEFLAEQMEEEHSVRKLCDRVNLIGTSGSGLLLLDFELAKRPCQCFTQCLCN